MMHGAKSDQWHSISGAGYSSAGAGSSTGGAVGVKQIQPCTVQYSSSLE